MPSGLEEIERELRGASERVRELGARLGDEAFAQRPALGRWSVAECIVHLSLTTEAYLPQLEKALPPHAPAAESSDRSLRRDATGWLLETVINARWLRTKTTAAFEPAPPPPRPQVVADFQRLQDELIGYVRRAEGRPLSSLRIVSPFAERMTYNLYSCFRILVAHQRRHLHQADAAAKARRR